MGFLEWRLRHHNTAQGGLVVLIRVMYQDNKYDYVPDSRLGELIEAGKIKQFCRTDGWVMIGRDPVRGTGSISGNVAYSGPERRRAIRAA